MGFLGFWRRVFRGSPKSPSHQGTEISIGNPFKNILATLRPNTRGDCCSDPRPLKRRMWVCCVCVPFAAAVPDSRSVGADPKRRRRQGPLGFPLEESQSAPDINSLRSMLESPANLFGGQHDAPEYFCRASSPKATTSSRVIIGISAF